MRRIKPVYCCFLHTLIIAIFTCSSVDFVSAQTRTPNRSKVNPTTSLLQNIASLEAELTRLKAAPEVKDQLHLEELQKLAAITPGNLDRASIDKLWAISKAFDNFAMERRNSSVFSLSTFKVTHRGLQALVDSLPKPDALQNEPKTKLDRTLKHQTPESKPARPGALRPDQSGGRRETAGTKVPTIPQVKISTGPIPCLISHAPRPSGTEKRDLLLALDTLQRNVFTRPDGARLSHAYPFAELKSLVSARTTEVASRRRLSTLLAELNSLSLDPSHLPSMRDDSVVNFHNHLRDVVEISNLSIPKVPLTPTNDLAAVEIFGTVDNMKSAKWILRIHVVACADDNGQRKSMMTKAQIQQGVAMANKVFDPVHLRFVFDPEKDWEDLKNTKINSWDLVDHDKNAAAYANKPALQSKIVLFSAFGPDANTPNGWAANGGTHIWLPTDGIDPSGLCHELGHFLGHLFHTFPGDGSELIYGKDPSKITAANVDSLVADYIHDPNRNKSGTTTEQAMDGDGFSDTPPDPGADYWGAKWPGKVCDPGFSTATIPNPKGGPAWVFKPDRTNLLSYFFRCPSQPTITAQQAAAILGRLEGTVPQSDNQFLTRLIQGQIPWSSPYGEIILVGKVRNVGSDTSAGGRTAMLESVGDGQTGNTPLGSPVKIGPLAPNDWVLVKVPMPGGLTGNNKFCLKISHGDANASNDTLCPEPYKAPQVK
jgi:hypothetical protein